MSDQQFGRSMGTPGNYSDETNFFERKGSKSFKGSEYSYHPLSILQLTSSFTLLNQLRHLMLFANSQLNCVLVGMEDFTPYSLLEPSYFHHSPITRGVLEELYPPFNAHEKFNL